MLFHFKQPLPKAASETSKSAGMDDEASESLLTTESRQPTAVVGEGIPAQREPTRQESLVGGKRVSCVKPFFRQSLSFVKYTLPKTLVAETDLKISSEGQKEVVARDADLAGNHQSSPVGEEGSSAAVPLASEEAGEAREVSEDQSSPDAEASKGRKDPSSTEAIAPPTSLVCKVTPLLGTPVVLRSTAQGAQTPLPASLARLLLTARRRGSASPFKENLATMLKENLFLSSPGILKEVRTPVAKSASGQALVRQEE